MVAVTDRCHSCGRKRTGDQRFCAGCGASLPALPRAASEPPGPPGGLAWTYRIPVINNRYAWIRWGWVAFAFAASFAGVLGTLITVMFPEGVAFALKVYFLIGALTGLVVLGLGLFAAIAVRNSVAMRFLLDPEAATATTPDSADELESAADWLPGMSLETAETAADAAALMLPSGGRMRWRDVRSVRLDQRRHAITLRRRFRTLRLYASPERYEQVAAYVREHAPGAATGGPRSSA